MSEVAETASHAQVMRHPARKDATIREEVLRTAFVLPSYPATRENPVQ